MLIQQLTVKEIDQIISHLQEPYQFVLIKRLEQLKSETIFSIKIHNDMILNKLDEQKSIIENGLGTSPVQNSYIKIVEY